MSKWTKNKRRRDTQRQMAASQVQRIDWVLTHEYNKIKKKWEPIEKKVVDIFKKKKGINIWGYLGFRQLPKWARRLSSLTLRYSI